MCEQMGFLKAIYQARFFFSDHYIHYPSPARGPGRGRSKNMGDHMVFRGGTVVEQSSITEIKWRTKEN